MNTELLLQIRDKILEEPENFDMDNWHCGTAHCIAGWAQLMATKSTSPCFTNEDASDALELSYGEAMRLFWDQNWPAEFRQPCTVAGQRAKQAAARIMHFISTEGRE